MKNKKKLTKAGLLALPAVIGLGIAGVTFAPQAHAATQTGPTSQQEVQDGNDAADVPGHSDTDGVNGQKDVNDVPEANDVPDSANTKQ